MSPSRRTHLLVALLAIVGCTQPGDPSPPSFKGFIIFRSDRVDPWQLFAIRPDGSGLIQLTAANGIVGRPSQGPDGSALAYTVGGAVWILPAGSLEPVQLTRYLRASGAKWAPDDSSFVYYSDGDPTPHFQIYRLSRDGSSTSRLTGGAASNQFPVWSPDSKYIAFDRFDGSRVRIYRYNMSTGVQDSLAADPEFDDFSPAYSSSGNQIAFIRNRHFAIMDAGGTNVRIIDGPTEPISVGSWSPDDTKIVATLGPPPWWLGIIDVQTGAVDTLLADEHFNSVPLWVR